MLPFSILTAIPAVSSAASPVKFNVSAGYTYDDNITRAELDSDIEKDSVLNADVTAVMKLPLNDISYFSFKGEINLNQYLDFSQLSNTRVGVHGSYHLRPTGGYTALRYFVRLGYIERLFKSDQRSGSATEIELGLSKRLSDLVSLRAGYIKEDIDSDESIGVFDADNNRFYADMEYKLNKKNNLYGTITYVDGVVVSTTVPTTKIIQASAPFIVRDDAFLDLTPARFAYRLDAKTTSLRVGDVYAISSNQAIDGSLLYYDSAAQGGNDYTGMILSIDYHHRF